MPNSKHNHHRHQEISSMILHERFLVDLEAFVQNYFLIEYSNNCKFPTNCTGEDVEEERTPPNSDLSSIPNWRGMSVHGKDVDLGQEIESAYRFT